MTDTDILQNIKKVLDVFASEYIQIVNKFDQSTMGTESMQEEEKMNIRMAALKTRCISSQSLLLKISIELNDKGGGLRQIKEYERKVNKLLTNIQSAIKKNNLQGMIKFLEEIPSTMSAIDSGITKALGTSLY